MAVAALAVACGGGGTKAPVKPVEPVALPIAGLATLDPHHGQRARFEHHLDEHRSEFERRQVVRPR